MKTLFYFILFFAFISINIFGNESIKVTKQVTFIENKGQMSDQNYQPRPDVLFSGSDGKLVYHLKNNGISYQLNRVDSWKEEVNSKTNENQKRPNQITTYRLDINWLNANSNSKIEKGEALAGYDNYYLEGCPNGVSQVKSYTSILYKEIYKGIDLKWYEKDGHLKYDYVVGAGVDYKQIQLGINGAEKICTNAKGELIIKTPLGEIKEQVPLVIQNRKQLKAKWVVNGNIVSFEIQNLNSQQSFIIDPSVRIWGTYYGGTGDDYFYATSVDKSGNVIVSGNTTTPSNICIATVGSHQTTYGAGAFGNYDAMLVKFNASGVRLWGTYYGGTGDDRGYAGTTDNNGNVFLGGQTDSNSGTVIATPGSHQPLFGGGSNSDAFLVKFDSNGVRQWGTYYGGNSFEIGYGCTCDKSGNVYLTGQTNCNTASVIATPGSQQIIYGGGFNDCFLVKFNTNGVRQWSTYYGGTSNESGLSCSTDNSRNVFLSGVTNGATGNIIVTPGCFQSAFAGGAGNTDAFLVKFDSLGIRQWGTYYGDVMDEAGNACTTDVTGNIYMTGYTNLGGTILGTPGCHQGSFAGSSDGFLVKFDKNGARLWGTYYGGIGSEVAYSCVTNYYGDIYIGGYTTTTLTTGQIATAGAYQTTIGSATASDAFAVKFNANGVRQWGTYYGGVQSERINTMALDLLGNLFIAGYSSTNQVANEIATPGSHQNVFGGSIDAILIKFFECPSVLASTTTNSICMGNTITISAMGATNYTWSTGSFSSSINVSPTTNTVYMVSGSSGTCSSSSSITINVNPNPTITATSSSSLLCIGQSATLTAAGANSYNWNPGGAGMNIVVSPTLNSTYTVTGTDANGCINITTITQSVSTCAEIKELLLVDEIKIFPNPNNGDFIISINKLSENTFIEVYNTLGQLIFRDNLTKHLAQINLKEKSNGLYFLKIDEGGKIIFTSKIIKE